MSVGSNQSEKNYRKISLLTAGIGFVVLGILLAAMPEKFTTIRMSSTTLIRIIGAASAVFFGVCTFFIAKQLLQNGNNDFNNER